VDGRRLISTFPSYSVNKTEEVLGAAKASKRTVEEYMAKHGINPIPLHPPILPYPHSNACHMFTVLSQYSPTRTIGIVEKPSLLNKKTKKPKAGKSFLISPQQ
jgi:hypothetical protein